LWNNIELSERIFTCCNCGHTEDRDLKAAKSILLQGQGKINLLEYKLPTERRNVKSVESSTSTSKMQALFWEAGSHA